MTETLLFKWNTLQIFYFLYCLKCLVSIIRLGNKIYSVFRLRQCGFCRIDHQFTMQLKRKLKSDEERPTSFATFYIIGQIVK